MPFLSADQRKMRDDFWRNRMRPLLNFFWSLIIASILFGLAARYLWSGYPPALAPLEPWFELTSAIGLAGAAILIARKNPISKK